MPYRFIIKGKKKTLFYTQIYFEIKKKSLPV